MRIPRKPDGYGISTRATIVRIVDGDTFECMWFGRSVKIRLLGCWVLDGSAADENAADYMRQFVGSPIAVWIPTDEATSVFDLLTFDRVLAWCWAAGEDESINEAIVRMGWGTTEKPKK